MAFAVLNEELNCSICLNVYADPVMLSCGHNFCCACIENVLDTQHSSGVYSCPQCRTEFKVRPSQQRNFALRNIAEHFLTAFPQQETSGILCTYCINASVPAIKTCVNCEASLCVGHTEVHNKFKEHMLIEPTACLEDRKCNIHKKILEYYCSEDSVCICVSCGLDGAHKGHQVASINEAFEKKRRKSNHDLEVLLRKRAETENQVQSLLHHKNNVEKRVPGIKEKVGDMFLEIQKRLDTLKETVLDGISRQETEVLDSVAGLILQLKTRLDKLSNSIINTEKLCALTDPFYFLRDQSADEGKGAIIERDNLKTILETSHEDIGDSAVGGLDEGFIVFTLIEGITRLVDQVRGDHKDLLLDPDTAANDLNISGDLRMVSWTTTKNCYPETTERFLHKQVLAKASFSSGCHYWQVETSEMGSFRFGVAYSSIDRKRSDYIGNNNKSWCLRRCNGKYYALHDNEEIALSYLSARQNLGVYLDYEAGRLSFYELGDPIRHLHTFTTTFTEPLHAAFATVTFARINGASQSMI
ncbi:E3 ubiquitin-protein ligase TRIM39-like [Gastrophryne carolinensis]